jgi:cytochrome P450
VVDHDLWLLSHPDDIEQVLVRDARSMHKDQIYELLVPALGRGLVTAEDDLWKRHASCWRRCFTPKRVDAWATVMVRCAREAALRFPATLDAHREMMALTQRIVLETLFGADLDRRHHRGRARVWTA